MSGLELRLDKLEKQNRRLKLAVCALGLAMLLAATLGAGQTDVAGDVLKVRQLIIEDEQQNERGFFGIRDGSARLEMKSPDRQKSVAIDASDKQATFVLGSLGNGHPRVVMHCENVVVLGIKQGELTNSIDPRMMYVQEGGQPRLLLGVHDNKSRIGLFGESGVLHWMAPPAEKK